MTSDATGTCDPPVTEVEITGEPTAVYRFYDVSGTLLYVGISCNLTSRWGRHAVEKSWWPYVARRTVVMYGSRAKAERAELTAIRTEFPVYNVMGKESDNPVSPLPDIVRKSPEARMRIARALSRPHLPPIGWPREVETLVYEYAEEHHITPAQAYSAFFMRGLVRCFWDDLEATEAGSAMTPAELHAAMDARLGLTGTAVPA